MAVSQGSVVSQKSLAQKLTVSMLETDCFHVKKIKN